MDTLEKHAASTADMIRIAGGTFRMGSEFQSGDGPGETLEDFKRRRGAGGG